LRITRYGALLLLLVPHVFGTSLTIDAAVTQFVEHNYDLQIARHGAQKSRADLITAKERPNPVLLGSYEFMDLNNHFNATARGSDAQLTLLLTHPIETGGKRDRRIDMAMHTITFSDLIYDETVREQLITLIDAYYTLLSDQADLLNAQENAKAYTGIVTIAKTKLDNGFLSLIDYQKILLQQIDYTKEVENSRLALVQDRETLASLLALPSSDITATAPIDPPFMSSSLEVFLAKTAERPDCKAAKQNLAVADASLNLEKANGIPNVSVAAEYASFGPTYEPLAGFNVSMPLPVYDRNEGDIEKARITTLQAASLYEKTLRMAKADVIQSYEATLSRQSVYKAMSEGFNAAKELKEKQEKIFALKGISVLELLDAQKSYREYQKNMTHAIIDLHIATAHLKLNSGLPLIDSKGY
jgi:outer membrane protein, heavy metal efflux system